MGPYLNKNVSNPVSNYEAALLRGAQIFYANDQPGVGNKGI
jgi:hypothetical protein